MKFKKAIEPLIYLFLIVVILAPRLPALDSFSTLDEPYWLSMGANFYYALGQREFQNTVYEYQPAVTTMWVITAAMLIYFPEYRGMGQGYLDYNKGWLDPFLLEHGKDPLKLLEISRMVQVFVILILFLVLYFLLKRFVPRFAAVFAILFASLDPFFLGQSRLLDHEAMLSLFVLISLLSLALYLTSQRKFVFLLLSGVAAGLAQLTKSSAVAMLLPVGILFLFQIYSERREGLWKALSRNIGIFLLWLVFLVAAYFVFWPGMWVAPGKMLYEVYGNAFSYAFQGARLSAAGVGDLEPSRFSLDIKTAGITSLMLVFLRRTTLFTWLGILFGIAFPFLRRRESDDRYKLLSAVLWVAAIAFIILFGVAQGRNSPHYILCAYLALNLLAGLGWFFVIEALVSRFFTTRMRTVQTAAVVVLFLLQVWVVAARFPYYFTYQNPIFYQYGSRREFPLFPYGEGLEIAGKYLSGLPDAKNSTALVYYSRGCFSYFYPGTTIGFRPYYVDGLHAKELLDALQSSDYLVIYYAVQGSLKKYGDFLDVLSTVRPIHEIWLDGRKYAVIYQVNQIPESVLSALADLKPQ
jgi:hypothetical protein